MENFKTAVILAGGKSSRMGFDKQFLKIDEKRLMDTLISELKTEFQDIIIVTNKPSEYEFINTNYRIVSDEIRQKGPLSGIHIGLKESKSKYVYFIACDMPKINLDYIRYMKSELLRTNADACVTEHNHRIEPFNAFYSSEILPKIGGLILKGRLSMLALIDNINTHFIQESNAKKYNNNFNMFFNLNTPKDLSEYKDIDKNSER
ncbi:molybdenum cofactor guanylyltransferase [Clostridium sp.]|jgi:molybdopterin-guanine dinucleotide biosynthesis protein A|uniref:molybdenum cofactor guanylyltransferase n=1 Tax=Clostridium sp. TaxID=1506 RepID=UPI002584A359|nr:molybdenum cofactor guanylyltransferase [Clostridium sp.]MDF2506033.1 mobA [Clostridium sp.]